MENTQSFTTNQMQKQTYKLNQAYIHSLDILALTNIELTEYTKDYCLSNPFVNVTLPKFIGTNPTPIGDSHNIQVTKQQSLLDYLLEQVSLTMTDKPLKHIVLYLIYNLDDNGYLAVSKSAVIAALNISNLEFEDALTLLQQLDPVGIGARNLQECLLLQIRHSNNAPKNITILITNYLNDLANHNWQKISQITNISLGNVQKCADFIKKLHPAPGNLFNTADPSISVYPELEVSSSQPLTVSLIKTSQIKISFNEVYYSEMLAKSDKELHQYLAAQISQFNELNSNLVKRNTTLLAVTQLIVRHQEDFFIFSERPIHPLLLRDIANELKLNISTISRTIKGKYLQTSFGSFPLKSFFSQRSAKNNNTNLSQKIALTRIKTIIKTENRLHPLSDEQIRIQLFNENIVLSRRTIAKYRGLLAIPSKKIRKQFQ